VCFKTVNYLGLGINAPYGYFTEMMSTKYKPKGDIDCERVNYRTKVNLDEIFFLEKVLDPNVAHLWAVNDNLSFTKLLETDQLAIVCEGYPADFFLLL